MSSSRQRAALTSESLPCPECGAEAMRLVVETCHLGDGSQVPRLRHFRCKACGARFFTDEAMDAIQSRRAKATRPAFQVAESRAKYGKKRLSSLPRRPGTGEASV